jgi:hypothetical protein
MGGSGLLPSPTSSTLIIDGKKTAANISRALRKTLDGFDVNRRIGDYCRLTGTDAKSFKEGVTFSYWREIPGYLRKVVADSAISDRYHITTVSRQHGKSWHYTLFDNGRVIELGEPLPGDLRKGLGRLLDTYDAVRNLANFDPNNCPVMEFVTSYGSSEDYFLQYLRGRDFVPSEFTLPGVQQSEGDAKALFVRGATGPEGMSCRVVIARAYQSGMGMERELPSNEDGFLGSNESATMAELMSSKRKLHIHVARGERRLKLGEFCDNHESYSTLMGPQVAVIVGKSNPIMPAKELKAIMKDRHRKVKGGVDLPEVAMAVNVVSDGRIAYLKRS